MNEFMKFITMPWGLFTLLVVLVICGWGIMVKLFSVKATTWRILDFVCLLVAAIGVLGLFGDNRRILYELELNKLDREIGRFESRLMIELDSNLYERTFVPGIYTQEEIALIEQDYLLMYSWIKQQRDVIIENINDRAIIDTITLNYPEFIVPEYVQELQQDIEKIKPIISAYNQEIKEYEYLKEGKEKKFFEILYDILSPLFVTIGLAYQIVKWLWDNNANHFDESTT